MTSSSLFLIGALDEVRIWNEVRTDADILDQHRVPLVGTEPGLVGYYKFDEPDGQDIFDSSPNLNDGTLGGTSAPETDDPVRIASGVPFSVGPVDPEFVRGDANDDATFDTSDPVAILGVLFIPGTPALGCADAGDLNDDGSFVSDGVYALAALFTSGPAPAARTLPELRGRSH